MMDTIRHNKILLFGLGLTSLVSLMIIVYIIDKNAYSPIREILAGVILVQILILSFLASGQDRMKEMYTNLNDKYIQKCTENTEQFTIQCDLTKKLKISESTNENLSDDFVKSIYDLIHILYEYELMGVKIHKPEELFILCNQTDETDLDQDEIRVLIDAVKSKWLSSIRELANKHDRHQKEVKAGEESIEIAAKELADIIRLLHETRLPANDDVTANSQLKNARIRGVDALLGLVTTHDLLDKEKGDALFAQLQHPAYDGRMQKQWNAALNKTNRGRLLVRLAYQRSGTAVEELDSEKAKAS